MMFVVYEFSLNSTTQLEKSLKYNWLGLMNDTTEDFSFDPKLAKANMDRTTLKLLPLLVKAIKKNAALEKLFDDPTRSSILNEGKNNEASEDGAEYNAPTKDGITPNANLLAIEYKTLPIVYFQSPTIEHYTKIRKIRDHQKIIKYFDKMINDKLYTRSSRQMQPEVYAVTTLKTVLKKYAKKTKAPEPNKKTTHDEHNSNNCKCRIYTNQYGALLNKIFLSIKKILPEINNHLKKPQTDCLKQKTNVICNSTKMNTNYLTEASIRTSFMEYLKSTKFPFENNSVTEAYSLVFNKTHHTTEFTKQLLITEENKINNAKTVIILDQYKYTPKIINKLKNVINQKQILSHPEIKLVSTDLEPVFGGIEYDDYSYFSTTPQNKRFVKDDNIHYVKTKIDYFNKISNDNEQNLGNTPLSSLKKEDVADISVIDNNIALAKYKPMYAGKNTYINKGQPNSNNITEHDMTAEEQLILHVFNSKPGIKEYIKDNFTKLNKTEVPFIKNNEANEITPKSTYFTYSEIFDKDKNIYHYLKNSMNTTLTKKSLQNFNLTPESNNKVDNIGIFNDKYTKDRKYYKNKKTAIYRIIENNVNTLLNKNISILKAKLNRTKSILQKAQINSTRGITNIISKPNVDAVGIQKIISNKNTKLNNTLQTNFRNAMLGRAFVNSEYLNYIEMTTLVPIQKMPILIKALQDNIKTPVTEVPSTNSNTLEPNEDKLNLPDLEDEDYILKEITKAPENGIELHLNITKKKQNSDLTWEDLTNEFMPAWRSMISDNKKSDYYEFRKEEKAYEQDDYNINSNFYDLNL